MTDKTIPFSVLDLAPIPQGSSAKEAFPILSLSPNWRNPAATTVIGWLSTIIWWVLPARRPRC